MRNIIQKTSSLIIFVVVVFMASSAIAGAPAGHLEALDYKVKEVLLKGLEKEGYRGGFRDSLRRNISAFLWDNRILLRSRVLKIPNEKQADLVICLMTRKGYQFGHYTNAYFMGWCRQQVNFTPGRN